MACWIPAELPEMCKVKVPIDFEPEGILAEPSLLNDDHAEQRSCLWLSDERARNRLAEYLFYVSLIEMTGILLLLSFNLIRKVGRR